MITIQKKNGVPVRQLTDKELELTIGFAVNYFEDRIEYLQAGDSVPEYPVEPEKTADEILNEAVDKRLKDLGIIPK